MSIIFSIDYPSMHLKNIILLYRSLDAQRKKKLFVVIVVMFVTTLLEMASVGLVVPAISILLKSGENIQLGAFSNTNLVDGHRQIYIGLSILFSAFVLKGLFLIASAKMQSKYVFSLKAYFSLLLYKSYIGRTYDQLIQLNSSLMIKNITIETTALVDRALVPGFLVLTEILVIIGIGIVIVYLQPAASIFLLSGLLVSMFFFIALTKPLLLKWGTLRQDYESMRVKVAQESILCIRDIILYNARPFFFGLYELYNNKAADIEGSELALQQYPKIFLEMFAVTLLGIYFIIQVSTNVSSIDIVTSIALFGAAAFRLMPSANRILNSIQSLRYSTAVIDVIVSNLELCGDGDLTDPGGTIRFDHIVQFSGVQYCYPFATKNVFENLNINILKYDCVGIVGRSGSGKSTFIDLLVGLIRPSKGDIFIDNINLLNNSANWVSKIGYVSQKTVLRDTTIRENVAFGLADSEIDDSRVMKALESACLGELIATLPNGMEEPVGEMGVRLSGGQLQRLGIARALYKDPEVLIFDEGTSALDSRTEIEIMDSILALKGKITLIIIAHRVSTLQFCDRIIKFESGVASDIEYSDLI